MKWIDAKESRPDKFVRALLKIKYEDSPVVGYMWEGGFTACTLNMEVRCGTYCQGGEPNANFTDGEVTHWAEITDIPEIDQ